MGMGLSPKSESQLQNSRCLHFPKSVPPHPCPLPLGENSPKDSRIEPLNVPQKKTPHPGPLPLGSGEGESSPVHLRREVHGEGEPRTESQQLQDARVLECAADDAPSP